MTANEAIGYLKEVLAQTEEEKECLSEYLRHYESEMQKVENTLTALKMGIGALELCEKAKERS